MFGGICFLMNGHMCVFIWEDRLVIRIGPDAAAKVLDEPHVGPMELTGRRMKGWAVVAPEGLVDDDALQRYVEMAIIFCASLPAKDANR